VRLQRTLAGLVILTSLLAAQAQPASYRNPVLPGFHADPSVCRMGNTDDYYLATSSFEYFPGVPVYHSKDLVHWRQVGHALTRESQLQLAGQKSSQGIFAPTLRCHDGRFYLVTTNIANGGSFYVTAKDPAGEWSEPIWVKENSWSMDPSLFFDDDGKVYYTRHGGGRNGGVYQAEIDIATGRLKDEPRLVWPGTGGIWPEGPHLYRHGGYYYLMISEGGTSYEHSLTLARSKTPWGPFEADPANPILTHRYAPQLPLQAVGHGDLVQSANGSWWVTLLGIRPQQRQHHIGRETLLAPAAWTADGWLRVNGGQPLALDMPATGLPASAPWPQPQVRDDFGAPKLALHWATLRTAATGLWSLTERPGVLRLKGSAATLEDIATPAFVGRRQEHLNLRAATLLDFSPTTDGQSAGLVLRQNEANHYLLRVTGVPQRRVELVLRIAGQSVVLKTLPLAPGPVMLQVQGDPDNYAFSFSQGDGPLQPMGSAPTQPLSSERAGGFTSVFVGLYATAGKSAGAAMPPADFGWFDYQPLGD
jgi:alpha-N-arabinofuranosidase